MPPAQWPSPLTSVMLYKEPQEYIVDGQEDIRHPIGMTGVRLEANVHIVTGAVSAAQNIAKCVNRCGLQVDDLIPAAIASSKAVLVPDESELGVCLVDIGAGTTDIAMFIQGAIRHTASLPIGGDQVTSDIAHGFAHADRARRGDQGQVCLCAGATGARRRNHPGAECRRPPAAATGAPDSGRMGTAALRRAVRHGAGRTAPFRI